MGSLGGQPPTDGFGTCSLHRFTRALKCVLREETRPKEKMIVTPVGSGVNSRAVRGPPPVPLGRVASFIASPHPPASPARAQVQAGRAGALASAGESARGRPLCQPCGASVIASPFNARHASVWFPRWRDSRPASSESSAGRPATAVPQRRDSDCSMVWFSALGSADHTCDHARLSHIPPSAVQN